MEVAAELPHPDDPALGVVLNSLVDQDGMSLNIDDRDLNVFALNPNCNATYLNMHSRIWVVHHVTPDAMRCMCSIDSQAKGSDIFPDLCACELEVVEEDDGEDEPFDYPRQRFNE